jgi:hypothetical protein
MQDRTINNALLALHRQISLAKTDGLEHVEALMRLRNLPPPVRYQKNPLARGKTQAIILSELQTGPKTTRQLGSAILVVRPGQTLREAANRSYQALLRMQGKGLVCREGGKWKGAAIAAPNHDSDG